MASAQPRTWSSWLGVDAESKASAAAKKEQETEAKHSKAVEELRNLFDCEEGRICGRQLAEGESVQQRRCMSDSCCAGGASAELSRSASPWAHWD
jgi:hypothetical protein